MESIFSISKTVINGIRRDMRVRWGFAGASVLLSAGVLGLGGSLTPEFLHASAIEPGSVIPQERTQAHSLEVVDMSTSTVFQIIQTLPRAERFDLMLYNSGAEQALKQLGTYTVFVPASGNFDYLPQGYISSLSRNDAANLALGHIVERALPLDASLNGGLITLAGTSVDFNVDTTAGTATVGGAQVLKAYKASNGYVYIIDKVLTGAN